MTAGSLDQSEPGRRSPGEFGEADPPEVSLVTGELRERIGPRPQVGQEVTRCISEGMLAPSYSDTRGCLTRVGHTSGTTDREGGATSCAVQRLQRIENACALSVRELCGGRCTEGIMRPSGAAQKTHSQMRSQPLFMRPARLLEWCALEDLNPQPSDP